jgi:hypothetical protein
MPTEQPSKPSEEHLRGWIARSWALLEAGETLTVPAEKAAQFELLWGPCAQAVRYATAWATLSSTDHAHESDVLARSALEHAMTAQWCYFADDGVQRLRVKVEQEYHRYYGEMAEWQNMAEVQAALARRSPPPPKRTKSLPNFTGTIVPMLDADNFLRASYRALSRSVHVNDSTVLGFLFQDGNSTGITPTPAVTNRYPAAFVAATSAMLALSVIADHLDSNDLLRDLNRTSNDLQLPMFLDDDRSQQMRDQYDAPTS